MAALKESGPARETKICMTCWLIIQVSEVGDQHAKHHVTGSFYEMGSATKQVFHALCKAKGQMKGNHYVKLFQISDQFKKTPFAELTLKLM